MTQDASGRTPGRPLRRRTLSLLGLGAAAGLGPLAAFGVGAARGPRDEAASWPDRPIRYVVPWPAGGPTDTFGRTVARELAAILGQPVVVENRTGASGTAGVTHVARSPADGHTLLAPNVTALIGSVVALGDAVQFDPLRDFTPIGLFVDSANVLWANPTAGPADFDALLRRARDRSQPPLAFGTTGGGSVSELSVEQLARHFGLELTKVFYRGTAPQVTDLVAGHVQLGASDFPTAAPFFRDGLLRPLLVIGRERLPELPGVPTNAELGITAPDFTIWNGLFAPAGTPEPIVAKLRAALRRITEGEAFRAIAEGNGNKVIFQTGEEATRRLAGELETRRAFAAEQQRAGL